MYCHQCVRRECMKHTIKANFCTNTGFPSFWLSLVVSLSSSSQSFDGFRQFLAHVQDLCFLFLNVIVGDGRGRNERLLGVDVQRGISVGLVLEIKTGRITNFEPAMDITLLTT